MVLFHANQIAITSLDAALPLRQLVRTGPLDLPPMQVNVRLGHTGDRDAAAGIER